jgi:Uma2 family endonuclease
MKSVCQRSRRPDTGRRSDELLSPFLRVRIPAGAGNLAGFRDWAQSDDFPERGVVSLLRGDILIDMSPDEVETHNKVHGAVGKGVSTVADEEDLGEYFWEGILVTNSRAGLSTVPDGAFVKWATWESGRARLIGRRRRPGQYIEIRGTPDWVLEVVSTSSVQKDTVELPLLYHRARIPEYWLVDARGEDIDFQILVRRPQAYRASASRAGWVYSPLFKKWFRLVRRPNRMGRWNYRLEVKAD